jgi:L-methionine (R)-S-oxide reductase
MSMAEHTLVADRSGDLRLSSAEKEARYAELLDQLEAVLEGEEDLLVAMVTAVGILHNGLPYFFWTGFYRRTGPELLRVGPYQGTLGCADIPFSRGVCGASARQRRTLIVDDVHAFPGHIACDAASRSEIVVPLLSADGELVAVLDVDSTLLAAFDEVDRRWLERVAELVAARRHWPAAWGGGVAPAGARPEA